MKEKEKLSNDELKQVTGGDLVLPINDSILQMYLGYTWDGLAIVLNPFLEYAGNLSYTGYVDEIKELLEARALNTLKIVSYKLSLNTLRPVAETGNFTEVLIIIDKLLALLSNF